MASLQQRARDFLRPRSRAVLAALMCIAVVGVIWIALVGQFEEYLVSQQRARLEAQLAGYNNALGTAMSRRLILLEGLQAFVEGELKSHSLIPPDEFQNVAGGLFAAFQGTHSI